MKRIAVIGCGGAGKSTLSRQLGAITGIEVIHLDKLHWKPGWTETPKEKWQSINEELVKGDSWIIDGNYGATMEIRLTAADTVIFLDYPRHVCIRRAFRRLFQGPRPDIGPGCPEKFDLEFFRWIWSFRRTSRLSLLDKVERCCEGKDVITLHSPREAKRFLSRMHGEYRQTSE
jgi:adenylate kinase family enzyme